ncbi:OLC1v1008687C1 [Oldenlandia corymbosa var. corymbosa]|uniref:OLC1v1008687C1 n=1 Tax=Oldenlandia corymbosa var. corymbosa TaxID=529605 RepID=A0AAV1DMB6_OLDCO|nr:OLC1v1008687C1 [Oldenlandia corymbosa var. corymbosa]
MNMIKKFSHLVIASELSTEAQMCCEDALKVMAIGVQAAVGDVSSTPEPNNGSNTKDVVLNPAGRRKKGADNKRVRNAVEKASQCGGRRRKKARLATVRTRSSFFFD